VPFTTGGVPPPEAATGDVTLEVADADPPLLLAVTFTWSVEP
jgi:hypothetical protein